MCAGLQKAEGEYITIIDTDFQQPPEKVLEMVKRLIPTEFRLCLRVSAKTKRKQNTCIF